MVRLERHIVHNDLHEATQSAYKKHHSTETDLLKISNGILCSIEFKQCTILASLDLSAVFDTVDHTSFIHKLHNEFGIEGKALSWFTSYLHNRQHRICVNGQSSESRRLDCGVPQGSVLGARMYTMYTRQLAHIIHRHGLHHHSYADDTQIYTHCTYQFSKATYMNDVISAAKLRYTVNPGAAKRIGSKVAGINDSNWDTDKYNVMKELIVKKFTGNEELKTELLKTGTKTLVECGRDVNYACGLPITHKDIFSKTKWTGKNKLADILCEVRSNIK